MTARRTLLRMFSLANNAYVNSTVTFYAVDANTQERTNDLITLYDSLTGTGIVANPYPLDSNGKVSAPVYFDTPFIASINDSDLGPHSTGVVYPDSGGWRGNWATDTTYIPGELVVYAPTGNIYAVAEEHLSGTFADDLDDGLLVLAVELASLTAAADILEGITSGAADSVQIGTGASAAGSSESAVAIGSIATINDSAEAVALGKATSLDAANYSVGVGGSSTSTSEYSVNIGSGTIVDTADYSVGIGGGTVSNSTEAVGIGAGSSVSSTSDTSVAIGSASVSGSADATAVGPGSSVFNSPSSTAVGDGTNISGSTDAVAMKATVSASNESVTIGSGTTIATSAGAIAMKGVIDTSASAVAIGDGAVIDTAARAVALGNHATVDNAATDAVAIGQAYASAANATAINIGDYTTTYGAKGAKATAIGYQNTASSVQSTAIGGTGNTASQTNAAVLGGQANVAASNGSLVVGGFDNQATEEYAVVVGGQKGRASKYGQVVNANGSFSAAGDAQTSHYTARAATTDATQTTLFLDGATGTKRITIASGQTIAFEALIVGRQTNGVSESAGYRIAGLIANKAGTTAIIGTIVKDVLGEDVAGWDATIEADDTNDALAIKVTGAVGDSVNWVASVRAAEVK